MKKIQSILIFTIFSLVSMSVCISGTRYPGTPDDDHVEYGKKFPFIGRLIIVNSKDELSNGSAVAYSDEIIITAAHVLESDIRDCFVDINGKKILIKRTIKHKDFKSENFGYCDIAIGLCEEPIKLEWYPELYTDGDEIGKICSMGGFGLPGTFSSGFSDRGDGLRRAGSNKIDNIERDLLICTPSSEKRTSLEYCISPGDSGGGLFIENKIAGINSCIMATNRASKSDYGSECGHTRISKFAPWIKENIKKIKE